MKVKVGYTEKTRCGDRLMAPAISTVDRIPGRCSWSDERHCSPL